ncbi:MAG TPA: [FeFe] hydrogenase H-cluster radical SAM maturase HydE [Acidobacteriota bacterium]|nr:[FeFe] hydrogenase H-cluster radical SAM maturase HydE [Acidobacteriota bacterium]
MMDGFSYSRAEALRLLSLRGESRSELFHSADQVRREVMGDAVHVRGIIEFSNICANDCLYCGIRASNRKIRRYTLDADQVLEVARRMYDCGQTTIVLQSGEAASPRGDLALGDLIRRIKREIPLAVTLSVGNRTRDIYAAWRDCGMDRYLLRFETTDATLFRRLHPDCTLEERIECLETLKELGVETGSGFMIGLPGERLDTLADNILLCRRMDFDMIGIGPFIAHPDTPLGGCRNVHEGDPEMFFVALAVLRLFNPDAHIPATTAFDAVFPDTGRDLALRRGANIFMPNNTPIEHRRDYLLYPNKPCVDEDPGQCANCVILRLRALGRTVGRGRGDSVKVRRKTGDGSLAPS